MTVLDATPRYLGRPHSFPLPVGGLQIGGVRNHGVSSSLRQTWPCRSATLHRESESHTGGGPAGARHERRVRRRQQRQRWSPMDSSGRLRTGPVPFGVAFVPAFVPTWCMAPSQETKVYCFSIFSLSTLHPALPPSRMRAASFPACELGYFQCKKKTKQKKTKTTAFTWI